MEKMRTELQSQGLKVEFIAINDITASDPNDQKLLMSKCTFPLFQDTDKVQAWKHHSGGKDDFFIFDANGKLAAYMPVFGKVNVDLSTQDGYDNLKKAIMDALKAQPTP